MTRKGWIGYNNYIMGKTKLPPPRNWVAKHNRHRHQRMRVRTQYQRHAKHRAQEAL